MPGHGEYTLTEFIGRLAAVEEKFAHELKAVIECFYQSRLDLPAKKLEDIGKVRLKASKHLKKIDKKKTDPINLWKICNIYSVCAVETDNAMREIRKSLRKMIVKSEKEEKEKEKINKEYQLTVNGNQYTPMRRLGDEYRPQSFLSSLTNRQRSPSKNKTSQSERPPLPARAPSPISIHLRPPDSFHELEVYDKHKPSPEEAARLSAWRRSVDGSVSVRGLSSSERPHVPSKPPMIIDARSVHSSRPQPSPRPRSSPNLSTKAIPAPPPPSHPSLPPSGHSLPRPQVMDEPIKVVYPSSRSDHHHHHQSNPNSRKNTLENSDKGKKTGHSQEEKEKGTIPRRTSSQKTNQEVINEEQSHKSVASITIEENGQLKKSVSPSIHKNEPTKTVEKVNEKPKPIVAPRRPQILMPESQPGRQMLRATMVTQDPPISIPHQPTSPNRNNNQCKPLVKRLSSTTHNKSNQPMIVKF